MHRSIRIFPDLGISSGLNTLSRKFSETNPILVVSIIGVIIIYYFVFSSLNVSVAKPIASSVGETVSKSVGGIGYMEISLWGLFIFLILINGMQLFLSIDVSAMVNDLFSGNPEVDITVKSPLLNENIKPPEKEVFHIPNNKYTFNDARAICRAYNSELATYDQIKDAHDQGAEWCSYGWSKDQLALFPTQSETYEKLRNNPGHEHDCGRPGINGGFIDNKNVRFGVNCYGYKPEMTQRESEIMANTPLFPQNETHRRKEERINAFREKIPKINLAPFNRTNWSQSGA